MLVFDKWPPDVHKTEWTDASRESLGYVGVRNKDFLIDPLGDMARHVGDLLAANVVEIEGMTKEFTANRIAIELTQGWDTEAGRFFMDIVGSSVRKSLGIPEPEDAHVFGFSS
jgi:hypothetical protein